jgi:hypothetical protein
MKYKKETWNQETLEDILTQEQLELLEKWLEVNGLKYAEYIDDMVYGVRVFGDMPNNGESWEIDFTRKKEEE